MDGTNTRRSWVRLRHLWGESRDEPSAPLHYPLLAALAIITSVGVTTWLFPREQGYLLSLGVLLLVIAYGVLFTSVRLWTDPVFVVLFGGYWLGLVVHYYHAPHTELLQYILVTPVAVGATVIVLPRFIVGRRQAFAMALTGIAVAIAAIGLVMLWQELQTEEELYWIVGDSVMGLADIRTVSVFHNPNTYGFFMMVGSLTALYTYLSRRGAVWFMALVVCVVGLVLSEGDAALVGFIVGMVVILSGIDRRLGIIGIGLAVLGAYLGIRVGHVPHVLETTLVIRVRFWIASLERLAQDPLLGIGFVDPGTELGEEYGPHNSYVHVLLNTGLIAGTLYIGALIYALGQGVRKRWTLWNAYVVSLATGVLLFMFFESLFLGGLSVSSIVLGIAVGLLLLPDRDTATSIESTTTMDALKHSRVGRAIKRIRALT